MQNSVLGISREGTMCVYIGNMGGAEVCAEMTTVTERELLQVAALFCCVCLLFA